MSEKDKGKRADKLNQTAPAPKVGARRSGNGGRRKANPAELPEPVKVEFDDEEELRELPEDHPIYSLGWLVGVVPGIHGFAGGPKSRTAEAGSAQE